MWSANPCCTNSCAEMVDSSSMLSSSVAVRLDDDDDADDEADQDQDEDENGSEDRPLSEGCLRWCA